MTHEIEVCNHPKDLITPYIHVFINIMYINIQYTPMITGIYVITIKHQTISPLSTSTDGWPRKLQQSFPTSQILSFSNIYIP